MNTFPDVDFPFQLSNSFNTQREITSFLCSLLLLPTVPDSSSYDINRTLYLAIPVCSFVWYHFWYYPKHECVIFPVPLALWLSFLSRENIVSERQANFKLQLVNASVSQYFLQNETGTCVAELSWGLNNLLQHLEECLVFCKHACILGCVCVHCVFFAGKSRGAFIHYNCSRLISIVNRLWSEFQPWAGVGETKDSSWVLVKVLWFICVFYL